MSDYAAIINYKIWKKKNFEQKKHSLKKYLIDKIEMAIKLLILNFNPCYMSSRKIFCNYFSLILHNYTADRHFGPDNNR